MYLMDTQLMTGSRRTAMSQLELRFSPSTEQDSGTFRLIELAPELCQLIDSAVKTKTTQPM
jgi:sister chromatid cohesion protein DCC1